MSTSVSPPTPLSKAAAYAYHYLWPVFPLRPKSKEPLVSNWPEKATSDIRQITAWLHQWPQANIALLCGKRVVVVDVDPRNGGTETWAELQDINGSVQTLESFTGGGGSHFFFEAPEIALAKSKLGPGVDLQGRLSYVVLPPSIHPNGTTYEWVTENTAPAPLPQWLLAMWPQAEVAGSIGRQHGSFNPHGGRPLPPTLQAQIVALLVSSELTLQRDGRYRGQCPFPHSGTGDCDCPASFYAPPLTGRWSCFCPDHPGTGKSGHLSGGPAPLLALAGVSYQPPRAFKRRRRIYLPRVEV